MTSPETPDTPLSAYGWDPGWAEAFAAHAEPGSVPGRIVRVDRGSCELVVANDSCGNGAPLAGGPGGCVRVMRAQGEPAGGERPCTGDWAAVDLTAAGGPLLRALLPRRTRFTRSTSSTRSEGQVLAVNIDLAVIAVSLSAGLELGRLERFLSLVWSSGARPVVALTKTDLVSDITYLVADVERAGPGATVLPVSAFSGAGLEELAAELRGCTSALLGKSGAGKSTLVNALLGEDKQLVAPVRGSDGKGRHTTAARDLLVLPGGGLMIDTPGLRGVGLWEAGGRLGQVFAEIEELAAGCRFHDCEHHAEPGCAVLAAVEDGTLPRRRFESYRKLSRESAWIASRTDARLRAELSREWRRREAAGREMYERKRGGKHRKAF